MRNWPAKPPAFTNEKLKELLVIKTTDSAKANARTVPSFTRLASDSAGAVPSSGVVITKASAVKKKRIKSKQTGLVSDQPISTKN